MEEKIVVDTSTLELSQTDTLLLCTDGLSSYVDSEEIFKVFKKHNVENVPDELVKLANKHGGGDNITVVTLTA